jgi:hypothetical protein
LTCSRFGETKIRKTTDKKQKKTEAKKKKATKQEFKHTNQPTNQPTKALLVSVPPESNSGSAFAKSPEN